jgi:broad specificity phosphatase PhoE
VSELRLLRHGETAGYEGDLGLSDRGAEQAREAAAALAAEAHGAVRVLHAPSVRARLTCEVLAEQLGTTAAGRPGALPPRPRVRRRPDRALADDAAGGLRAAGRRRPPLLARHPRERRRHAHRRRRYPSPPTPTRALVAHAIALPELDEPAWG